MTKKLIIASVTLIGTIIGAGILGIPFVIMKSGFGLGLINMIFIALIMVITILYLGEISQRTKKNHHLTGYAEKYLGKKGKMLMFIAFSIGIYSALLAYIIGVGQSLSQLFFNIPDFTIQFGILFWLVLSAMTYSGLKTLKDGELFGIALIFILLVTIIFTSFGDINFSNLAYNNLNHLFTPFGVILFAFLGFASVPEVKRILGKDQKLMKKTIIYSYLTAFIIYALFAAIVLGLKGTQTPQIATLALGIPFILLGILTMFTSYLAISNALVDTLKFDFKKSKNKAWLITISLPLILFLILEFTGTAIFTKVLGIGGVISGGLTAIIILHMVKKSKENGDQKPAYSIPYHPLLIKIMVLVFITGAVIEVMNIL